MKEVLSVNLTHEEILLLYQVVAPLSDNGTLTELHIQLQNYLFKHLTIEEMQKLIVPIAP